MDACEAQNFQLAQAIIDSANIILPNGLLNDCYDELGNRYQLPIYVIAKPLQIGSRNPAHDSSKCDKDSLSGADESVSTSQTKSDKKSKKSNRSSSEKRGGGFMFKKSSKKCNRRKSDKKRNNAADDELDDENPQQPVDAAAPQEEASFPIKLRLSTHSDENDVKFDVYPSQRVLELKNKVKQTFNIEPINQKMYFGGKQLHDKDRLKAYRLKENIVVQVIVSQSQINHTQL